MNSRPCFNACPHSLFLSCFLSFIPSFHPSFIPSFLPSVNTSLPSSFLFFLSLLTCELGRSWPRPVISTMCIDLSSSSSTMACSTMANCDMPLACGNSQYHSAPGAWIPSTSGSANDMRPSTANPEGKKKERKKREREEEEEEEEEKK